MNSYKLILSFYFFFFLLFVDLLAQNPQLSNQGALISVKSAAFLSVRGSVLNAHNGSFHNTDTIHVFGDWENNANNEAFANRGSGVVTFRGNDQRIKGTNITRFYDLRLQNSGVKYGEIDIYVDGFLRLTDRELNMDTNVVHLFNINPTSLTSGPIPSYGFVSALGNGGLSRSMTFTTDYVYFLGSSQGLRRFRPIHIRPENPNSNIYIARFANNDASLDNYDRNSRSFEICEVNPNFYHKIERTSGTSAAFVDFFIDTLTDGNFNGLAHWKNAQWNDVSEMYSSTNTYFLNKLSADSVVRDFLPNPFALVKLSPSIELLANENPICDNEMLNLTANGNYSNFNFIVDSLLLQSGSSSEYQTTLSQSVPVWVTANNASCGRTSDTLFISVLPSPTAVASQDTIILESTAANIYAQGGDFYEWSPTFNVACNVCPFTSVRPDSTTAYIIRVENLDGCFDYDTVFVTVKKDLEQLLFIPNVITPNNDGFNDFWHIENIQFFPSNKLVILNRWGDLVYESLYYNNNWNGEYGNGLLPAGTYYYILDLGQEYGIFKGDVTIIRK
jgi:gliding motility-associated-like protein